MGVSWHHVKALVDTYRSGASFENTLTLGRLNLFISPWELQSLLDEPALAERFDSFLAEYPVYAEPLFQMLGAKSVQSIDASDYEGATIVHDLNMPLPEHVKGRFDLVDDGGTLEHVFNFPMALKNCMEAVKVGGHLLINTVANNFLGHGFYQLSPELFYRALSPVNGFKVERLVLHPTFDGAQWYEVMDPDVAERRGDLVSDRLRIGLWLRAKRVSEVPIFATWPQQSDYQKFSWKSDRRAGPPGPNKFLNPPNPVKRKIRLMVEKMSPPLLTYIRKTMEERRNRVFGLESQKPVFKAVKR
jgi:hypothetical protein